MPLSKVQLFNDLRDDHDSRFTFLRDGQNLSQESNKSNSSSIVGNIISNCRMKDVIDVLELQGQREKSARKPIDYRCHDSIFIGSRYLFECGLKIGCKSFVVTTAAHIFHKFFKETDVKKYDIYLIASTCLYLASKIKDDPVKIRDVINVSHNTLYRSSLPLDLSDHYWTMRDAIIQAELLVMRMIKFQVPLTDPHKYVLQYYNSLKAWLHPQDWKEIPLVQNALAFVTDFYHDSSVVNYRPEHLAIAGLFLALQCQGVSVPGEDDGLAWFTVFDNDLSRDKVWEIAERMMDCYDRETVEIS